MDCRTDIINCETILLLGMGGGGGGGVSSFINYQD